MDRYSLYLPIDRRKTLVTGNPLPDRATGAVLFADLSGFTAMTDTLTSEFGPRLGAEEVTHQLDRIYHELIVQVERYGGSVIEFAGDAITCWFDGDPGQRATACATAMQAAMGLFAAYQTPGGTPIELVIKVCAVAGAVRRFLVGDPDIGVIEVLAGHTLERINVAGQLVQKGEVLLSENILTTTGLEVRVAEWRTDSESGERFAVITQLLGSVAEQPWPAEYEVTAVAARPWILRPIYERLREGQEHFLAELRPVTALFLRFGGIDYDGDDAAGQKIDGYLRWVQRVIDRYEGSLLQASMGDKGSYLYAAFGAPLAHEDDSNRAVAAALDLLQPPQEFGYIRDISIGISRGQMRAGPYGSRARRSYGVLGSEVNVAARLMQKAGPGQLLVTDHIVTTAWAYTFQDKGTAILKGVPQPVPIFSVSGRRNDNFSPSTQTPLVGREGESRLLRERLQALAIGRAGNIVILEGEAGLDKSRLVGAMIEEAQALAIRTLYGAGDSIERATPYYAWRSILTQALDLTRSSDEGRRKNRVIALLQADARLLQWAPLLSDVLQLELPPNEVTLQMPSAVQADSLQELLANLLTLAFRTEEPQAPTLLVIDDAHWLDSSSWALLRIIVDRSPSLLIVLATRPLGAPVPEEYTQLIQRPGCDHLVLQALPSTDVETLVCRRLGANSLAPDISSFIHEKAEGNPFFCEELALALRDKGLIQVQAGVCRRAPGIEDLRALDIPSTIQGVITSRVDRLSPPQQLTLKVASIIGRIFAYSILQEVHPIGSVREQLRDHLDVLNHLDITRLFKPEPELAYMFKHIISQEVVYNLMILGQRQQLHRAVAAWYEKQYAADLAPYYSLLAYHWQHAAEDPQAPSIVRFKAIEYLDLAGDQALRSSAYKEAIDFYGQAMTLEPVGQNAMPTSSPISFGVHLPADMHRRAQRYLKLGEALRNWGRTADSRTYLERAAALYGYPVPTSTRQAISNLLRQVMIQLLHRLWPGRYVGHSTQTEETVLTETARTYLLVAEVFFFTNEVLLSLYAAVLSLNLSETAGLSAQLASTYSVMSLILGTAGQDRWARAYQQLALDTAHKTGLPIAVAEALRSVSLYYVELGRWAEAEENLKICIDIESSLGNKRDWGDLVAMLAGVYAFRGDLPHALELLASVEGPLSGSLIHRTISALWRGGFLLRLGRFDEAVQLLRSALDLTAGSVDALSMVYSKINTWAYLSAAYLRQEKYALAREAADTAWRMIAEIKPGAFHLGTAFEYVAETYLALIRAGLVPSSAERKQLIAAAKRLARDLSLTSSPTTNMRGWRCQGLYQALQGQMKQALQWWNKYLLQAEQLEMPFESGIAHLEIGRYLPVEDPVRVRHLTRARELFEKIGALYELAQTERELALSQAKPTDSSN